MSIPLVVVVTLIYGWVGLSELMSGRTGLGLMFVGYAFANCGILWEMAK